MVILQVESDAVCWGQYANQQQFDAQICQFIAINSTFLATGADSYDLQIEPSERAWEMVSTLKQYCRFPTELEMEVYSGVIGREAAVCFLSWCTEQRQRPLSAEQILNHWEQFADQAAGQRDDIQAASMNVLTSHLGEKIQLNNIQQDNLVAYIEVLPRDMRFGFVKTLLRIPAIATILSQDCYDHAVLDALNKISEEVA